jgi:hypothetical protein
MYRGRRGRDQVVIQLSMGLTTLSTLSHILYITTRVHNSKVYVVEFASTCKISVYMYRGRRGRDRIVVGFTTACEINTYHQYSCDFESRSCRSVSNTTSGFLYQ